MEFNKNTERVNYIKEGDRFIGLSLNLRHICQANSLDELKKRQKSMAMAHLEYWTKLIQQDEPFELKEVTQQEWEQYYNK